MSGIMYGMNTNQPNLYFLRRHRPARSYAATFSRFQITHN